MTHDDCLICLVSTVSGCSKNALRRGSASSRHITKLEQSTFLKISMVWANVSYSALFTFLVGWHASAASLLLGNIILSSQPVPWMTLCFGYIGRLSINIDLNQSNNLSIIIILLCLLKWFQNLKNSNTYYSIYICWVNMEHSLTWS